MKNTASFGDKASRSSRPKPTAALLMWWAAVPVRFLCGNHFGVSDAVSPMVRVAATQDVFAEHGSVHAALAFNLGDFGICQQAAAAAELFCFDGNANALGVGAPAVGLGRRRYRLIGVDHLGDGSCHQVPEAA